MFGFLPTSQLSLGLSSVNTVSNLRVEVGCAMTRLSVLTYSLANGEISDARVERAMDYRLRVGGEERLVLEVCSEFLDIEGPVKSSA
jgi:hypothetical protein